MSTEKCGNHVAETQRKKVIRCYLSWLWRDAGSNSSNAMIGAPQLFQNFSLHLRIGTKTPRGYELQQFQDAFTTYLPPEGGIPTATPQH